MPEDWTRRFNQPLRTPDGRTLKTLDDARRYLVTFSVPRQADKRELLATALRTVLNAASGTDVMMHARIAVGRWVHRDGPPGDPAGLRKRRAKAYRIVK